MHVYQSLLNSLTPLTKGTGDKGNWITRAMVSNTQNVKCKQWNMHIQDILGCCNYQGFLIFYMYIYKVLLSSV